MSLSPANQPGAPPPVVQTGGGDYAAGDIHKQSGVFVSGGAVQGGITYTQVTVGPGGTYLDPAPPVLIQRSPHRARPPRALRTFRNRQHELDAVGPELRPDGGAWLCGPPGCGLSSLLLQLANTPEARALKDGVVNLNGRFQTMHLDDVLPQLFQRFYTCATTVSVTPDVARSYLAGIEALLLCDKLPLPMQELMQFADDVRPSAVLLACAGRGPDTLLEVCLDGMPRQEAVRLCATEAGLNATGAATNTLLEQLCAAVGDLPHPVVLLGQLIASGGADLARVVTLLHEQASGEEPLVRTVLLLVQGLSKAEQGVLAALVRVGGPVTDQETLIAVSQQPAATVADALTRLEQLGLITCGTDRYTVATHSLEQVFDQVLELGDERERAAAFFGAALARYGHDANWLIFQRDNLLTAIDTCLKHGQAAQAGTLAQALHPVTVMQGLWGTWAQVLDQAERAAQMGGDQGLHAWVLHERGTRAGLLGDLPTAGTCLEQACQMRRRLGDHTGAAISEHNLKYLGLLAPVWPFRRVMVAVVGVVVVLLVLLGIGMGGGWWLPGVAAIAPAPQRRM